MYDPPSLPLPKGGRINESRPKSKMEWIEYYAREVRVVREAHLSPPHARSRGRTQLPGPGQYAPAPLLLPEGGRINSSNSKGWLDWVVYRTQEVRAFLRPHSPSL